MLKYLAYLVGQNMLWDPSFGPKQSIETKPSWFCGTSVLSFEIHHEKKNYSRHWSLEKSCQARQASPFWILALEMMRCSEQAAEEFDLLWCHIQIVIHLTKIVALEDTLWHSVAFICTEHKSHTKLQDQCVIMPCSIHAPGVSAKR